ncbi:MAG: serine protease [Acaryochloridaceae cyanobacterium SU_2_1]|nr:serine protease [Acaryochloridaceae cyanobacterium SU_2_1]
MNNPFPYGLSSVLVAVATVVMTQSQGVAALTVPEISQIAKSTTVHIDSQSPGSGVIIQRNGNHYTVLTSAHVVLTEDTYDVVTFDGQRSTVDNRTIKRFTDLDLAILKFTSSQAYPAVKIGDSAQVLEGSSVYVAGFPIKTAAITESIYNFTLGEVTANANRPLANGYALVYSNSTLPGMSGGPVLDNQGQLIGIHGRADISNPVKPSEINPGVVVKTGFNLGIPINSFLEAVPFVEPSLALREVTPTWPTQSATASDFYLQAGDKHKQGDLEGAIANYDAALKLKPDFAEAQANRKLALASLADYHQAVGGLAKIYLDRGNLQQALKDYGSAIADYTQAISLNPQYADAYYNRGVVHQKRGNLPQAKADLETAATLFQQQNRATKAEEVRKQLQQF